MALLSYINEKISIVITIYGRYADLPLALGYIKHYIHPEVGSNIIYSMKIR